MKIKTATLIGPALDWAVAKALSIAVEIHDYGKLFGAAELFPSISSGPFRPSTNWAQGGPIIERKRIGILFRGRSAVRPSDWFATPNDQDTSVGYEGESFDPTFMVNEASGRYGPTPLIAAMRCLVSSRLGDEVDIPKELT